MGYNDAMHPLFQWPRMLILVGIMAGCVQAMVRAADDPKKDAAKTVERASETGTRIAADCDALLGLVIKKPYGWALPAADATERKLPRGAAVVDTDVMGSSTAGLMLLYAGQALGRADYREAAWQMGRGLMAAQQRNGRVPARATFSNSAANRDAGETLRSRQSTAAAMSLLLALSQERPGDDAIRRGAHRAALWIAQQQPPAGGFPTVVELVDEKAPVKMLRLDNTGYRDALLALLYADDVLDEPIFKRAIERAIQQLMKMRMDVATSRTAKGLWRAAYEMDASPSDRIASLASAVDILATRYALQATLAHHLFTGSEQSLSALNDAATSLAALRYQDGQWQRLYPLKANEIKPIAPGPAPVATANPFERPVPLEKDLFASSTFDLLPVLEAAERVRMGGRQNYLANLDAIFTGRHQMALALAGLTDLPLTMPLPQTPEKARAALAGGDGSWEVSDALGLPNVQQRIERIHGLLLRHRLETLAARP